MTPHQRMVLTLETLVEEHGFEAVVDELQAICEMYVHEDAEGLEAPVALWQKRSDALAALARLKR